MTRRVLCPRHDDTDPSAVVYDNGAWCFVCGVYIPLSELRITVSSVRDVVAEDVAKTLEYINQLPRTTIRGIDLPHDDRFYYIVWPDGSYYKKRAKTCSKGSKYLCPAGVAKPLFTNPRPNYSRPLAVVEGELNAISLSLLDPPFDVCSPGGAAEFTSRRYLQEYTKYGKFILVADADPAGLEGAVKLKLELLKKTPRVKVHLMEIDCNDLLVRGGDFLSAEVGKMLGVSLGGG